MAQRRGFRPSLANLYGWQRKTAHEVKGLRHVVRGNGKPGILERLATIEISGRVIAWALGIGVPGAAMWAGWMSYNLVEQGKAIAALTAAMQNVLK